MTHRTIMETIRAEGVVKCFGKNPALAGVTLTVAAGEMFFLLGPSGCGKSTLLRCIAGLETPDSGVICFGDRDVTGLPAHRRETAMVFQSYALWPHLSVAQNIAFGLEERRIPKAEIKSRVEEVLKLVHLEGFGPRTIDQMSGGQQQRVALARAMVVKPRCLLLDEPLSNLDAQLRVEMRREIRSLVKGHGLTAIYVTHDQEEALALADRMAILDRGCVVQTGSPEEIYCTPQTAMVAGFIGETNLLSGEVTEIRPPEVMIRTVAGLMHGRLADPAWRPAVGTSVRVSIRPEAWQLHQPSGDNPLAGKIIGRSYLGQRIQYWVDTAVGVQQVVEMNPRQIQQPGNDDIRLHVPRNDVVVVKC